MFANAFRRLIRWFRHDFDRLRRSVVRPGHGLSLNLGCGRRPLDGFHNVDIVPSPGVDTVADLNRPLPFESATVSRIFADNVFEHIDNYVGLLTECSRVLESGGQLVVDVPYFRSSGAFVDPTHRNFFTLRSMRYFVPNTYESRNYGYLPVLFERVDVIVNPNRGGALRAAISLIANARPELVDDTIVGKLIRIDTVRFVLSR